jgi:hypothetical protein
MELIPGSEMSTHLIQTPGIYPEDNTLHQQHGESLKTKTLRMFSVTACVKSGPEVTRALFIDHVELHMDAAVDCETQRWSLATLSDCQYLHVGHCTWHTVCTHRSTQ